MKHFFYFITICCFVSCQTDTKTTVEKNSADTVISQLPKTDSFKKIEDSSISKSTEKAKPIDGSTAQNSIYIWGTYKGVLPCADCNGINTKITLNKDFTFIAEVLNLGKKNDEFPKLAKGEWKWIDGFTIELVGVRNVPNKYFVGENKIIQLDNKGKKINGENGSKYFLLKLK